MAHFERSCGDAPKTSDSVSVELPPAAQARDWRQRWNEIQEQSKRLLAPRCEAMSGKSIQSANHDLRSFLVQAYHLKDSLIHESTTTGISKSAVESAIDNDPHLALLADLANLEKHRVWNLKKHKPRSGHVPAYATISGKSTGPSGWRLSLEIQHNGNSHDGLTFASDAVSAWEKQLKAWGLI